MVRAQIGDVMKVTVTHPHRQTIVLTLMTQAAADYATELLNDPEKSGWRLEAKRSVCICPPGQSLIDCPACGARMETLPAHLQDDAPFKQCSNCGRKSWEQPTVQTECGMKLPSGRYCAGQMLHPDAPL